MIPYEQFREEVARRRRERWARILAGEPSGRPAGRPALSLVTRREHADDTGTSPGRASAPVGPGSPVISCAIR